MICSTTQSSFLKTPKTFSFDHHHHHHRLRLDSIAIGLGNTQFPRPSLWTKTRSGSHRVAAAMTTCHETTKNFYDLLGISEKGTILEIKKAYKQLARRYHPDVSPPERVEENTKRFIQVQQAYETLSDPNRRALYDRDLSFGLHLAFSSRTHKDWEVRTEWEDRWLNQLEELRRRRSMDRRDSGENMSWGARMRSSKSKASSTVVD